jgi:hypothetical protein
MKNNVTIKPENEILGKEQRKIIDRQKKLLDYYRRYYQSEMTGLVNSKLYSYLERSTDKCFDFCNRNDNRGQFWGRKVEVEETCIKNCIVKNISSFYVMMQVISLSKHIFIL